MKKTKKKLYIDALALVPEKKSGVGVTLEQTLDQLLKLSGLKEWHVYLVVTLGKAKYLSKYQSSRVHIKTIPVPARVLEVLSRARLLLPVDWFLGVGVYIFPNYRNWPLWRSRSLTYIYDIAFVKYPETVQVKNQKYLHRYMPGWVRRTDRIVTISNQVKYEIEKFLGVAEAQIEIVPCGVDQSLFYKRDSKEIESIKTRYNIAYKNYFLFVGNIEPRKNLEKLLDAYSLLPATTQDEYGLVFIGGHGWQNEAFYKKLEAMQTVHKNVLKVSQYVPASDLPALYSGATMLIHPAIYEGFGMTPLEAMACATPVVVSDTPAIREVVQEAGIYFDPSDAQEVAAAISRCLTDTELVAKNVDQGLAIADQFSWKQSAQELLRVVNYEQGIGPHRHPMMARLKRLYQVTDNRLLYIFGERAYPPYVPAEAESTNQLEQIIIDDFSKEQPSRSQLFAKKVYLGTKHSAAIVLKKAYHSARSVRKAK